MFESCRIRGSLFVPKTMTEAEYFQKLDRKNKTSAVFFFAGAAAVFVITALFILFFMFVFGALQATFDGILGNRAAGDTGSILFQMLKSFWVFIVFALAAIAPQIVAGIAMLKKLRWARTAGIAAFFLTLMAFTPVALLLIYPLVFLLGNDGKYLYKTLIK